MTNEIKRASGMDGKPFERGTVGVAEACEFLSVSKDTLYKLMDAGKLDYSQPTGDNGIRLVSRKAMVDLLAENSRQAGKSANQPG